MFILLVYLHSFYLSPLLCANLKQTRKISQVGKVFANAIQSEIPLTTFKLLKSYHTALGSRVSSPQTMCSCFNTALLLEFLDTSRNIALLRNHSTRTAVERLCFSMGVKMRTLLRTRNHIPQSTTYYHDHINSIPLPLIESTT